MYSVMFSFSSQLYDTSLEASMKSALPVSYRATLALLILYALSPLRDAAGLGKF